MTTETIPVLTRDQRRAQHALSSVRQVETAVKNRLRIAQDNEKNRSSAKKYRAEYLSRAESLPAAVVMNGLGQACAMLLAGAKNKSADESAYQMIYEHLQNWLCQGNDAVYQDAPDLVEAVIRHGQNDYVRAQGEALAYLDWLKKFAQAYLAGEED